MHIALAAVAVLAAVVPFAGAARAAESFDACAGFVDTVPAVISTQGVWCLRQDLASNLASGNAIHIAANNVTIDCNGFKIGGLSAGPATLATGVRSSGQNTTVRGCTIRGFHAGTRISGDGALVEDNRIEASTAVGIHAEGHGTTVRRNSLLDTGRPTGTDVHAIYTRGVADIGDNAISGVEASGTAWAVGIRAMENPGGVIFRNTVRGLVHDTTEGFAMGIYAGLQGYQLIVEGNRVSGTDAPRTFGVYCAAGGFLSVRNIVLDMETPIAVCSSNGDVSG